MAYVNTEIVDYKWDQGDDMDIISGLCENPIKTIGQIGLYFTLIVFAAIGISLIAAYGGIRWSFAQCRSLLDK